MATVTPTAQRTAPDPETAPRHAPAAPAEWWIGPLGWAALAVFIALPVLTSLFEAYAGGSSGRS